MYNDYQYNHYQDICDKYRNSHIIKTTADCPLTGYFADMDVLNPVIDCITYKRFFTTYEDLITDCLQCFFQTWSNDIEFLNSQAHFAEYARENELYFTIDGAAWED